MTVNFFHPKEECFDKKCTRENCERRHPKTFSFYRRKKCKFEDKCACKHDGALKENLTSETVMLRKNVETLKSENDELKKVIDKKDIAVLIKADQIKDLENNIEKLLVEIKNLKQDNSKKVKELNQIKKASDSNFKLKDDLIKQQSKNDIDSLKQIKKLEKRLNDKERELFTQMKRITVI